MKIPVCVEQNKHLDAIITRVENLNKFKLSYCTNYYLLLSLATVVDYVHEKMPALKSYKPLKRR